MGLIDFFKKMFTKKVISLPDKRRDVLVQPLSSGYSHINIGQKLVVDAGWSAVIVAKEKVLDVFMEGTHELNLAYIPKTTKELKLDKGKVRKNGVTAEVVLPKSFKCDLYFVKMEHIQGRTWESDFVKVREKEKKNLKYQMKGTYSFQVQSPAKAVELFLIDWAKIKTGKAILKLDSLVGDMVSEILWKKKFKSKEELVSYDFANIALKPATYKNFIKYGICITDMQTTKVIYPESFKGEHFEEVTPEKVSLENSQGEDDKVINISTNETEITFDETQKLESPQQEETEKTDTKLLKQSQGLAGFDEKRKIPFYSFDGNKNSSYKTADTLKNEKQQIICANCGAILPNGSKFCNICGKLILKENENE